MVSMVKLIGRNRSQLDPLHRWAEQVRIELHAPWRAFLLQAQVDGGRWDTMRIREERRLRGREMYGESKKFRVVGEVITKEI